MICPACGSVAIEQTWRAVIQEDNSAVLAAPVTEDWYHCVTCKSEFYADPVLHTRPRTAATAAELSARVRTVEEQLASVIARLELTAHEGGDRACITGFVYDPEDGGPRNPETDIGYPFSEYP
jgi:hypothetical protein